MYDTSFNFCGIANKDCDIFDEMKTGAPPHTLYLKCQACMKKKTKATCGIFARPIYPPSAGTIAGIRAAYLSAEVHPDKLQALEKITRDLDIGTHAINEQATGTKINHPNPDTMSAYILALVDIGQINPTLSKCAEKLAQNQQRSETYRIAKERYKTAMHYITEEL